MLIVDELAKAEGLTYHVSPLFLAKKAGKPLGRIVFNFSHNGPNHLENKALLSAKYGPIVPPQLGNTANLLRMLILFFLILRIFLRLSAVTLTAHFITFGTPGGLLFSVWAS
jgi:hypothetical protein